MTQSQSRSRGRGKKMEPASSLRVATYRRISTNEDNQPHSLEAQEKSLSEYIARSPEMVHVADFHDMQTGTNTDRPGLQALLDAAAEHEFDVVLFYRIDRIARSVYDFMGIHQTLQEHGVAVRSATEPIETVTPAGKLMAQVLASFAEFEHDVLIDRIHQGYTAKARKGEWLGGLAPFGYANDREHSTLTVVPEEAAVVRRIYRQYLAGDGAKTISETLNAAGIMYRGSRRWNQQAILRILASPTNAGLIERNDEYLPALHPAIVSRDDFDKVMALRQTKFGADQFAKMAAGNSEFFLTGVVRCGSCSGAVVGAAANSKGRRYRYYDCSMKAYRAESERCHDIRVDADALEAEVVGRLLDAYRDSDLFPAVLARLREHTPSRREELDEQLAAVEVALTKSTAALDRYYAAFENGELDPGQLRARVGNLSVRLDAERHERERLCRERDEVDAANDRLVDLSAAVAKIEEVLGAPQSWHSKRRLIGALVESIVVSPGREVRLTLRVPTVGAEGPGQVLPGGRTRRPRAGQTSTRHTKTTSRHVSTRENLPALIPAGEGMESTPFRMGSHVVEPVRLLDRTVVRNPLN